ncbi:DinB superfamily protein [Mucilaginibacter gossypiicola]|uniref:DinB superfamily protein n=1 Tax=Mucilaginibacter gossypiicola TaxID=551995 RepID=A0A1H8UGV5_9SPHI|nr:DinB family protein [Mucilaginibacter gossypiicola]SEP02472.1 DinB superfamily protein [Mucilaginibacter gossypiicola]
MNEVTDKLTGIIDKVRELKDRDIDWTYKASSSKWSKKEVIGHLIDSAQINLQRFVRCTYEENFRLTYEQVEWVAAAHYQDADIHELIELWALLNLQIARVLENYPADRWGARCDNSKQEPNLQTVEWLAADYVDHMLHHLKGIL